METATLLYLLLAILIALLLAVFQYLYKNSEKSQLKYWLFCLRFLSAFLILLLFINPTIKKRIINIDKPNLIVAVDNSSSIKYVLQDNYVTEIVEKFKEHSALNKKFNLNYYSLGTSLKPLDSLNFNEKQTNLSQPLNEFSELYKNEFSPVVLITDGNQTIGNNLEYIHYKKPVFPLIVGDTTEVEDIFIDKININKSTYIHNKLPVEIFVNYKGSNTIAKNLSIYYKRKKVFSKKLEFSENHTVQIASFYLTAEEKGNQYYTAKIEELKDELNTINNSKSFSINVIEETSKIAIVSSILHPDLGMFKKAIESNKQREVSIFNSENFKENTSNYQLIILYQPTADFKSIFDDINKNKLSYLIISGISTDWNFLNTVQTNVSKNVVLQTEDYSPIFNHSYESFLFQDIGFSNLPPLEDLFGNVSFKVPYHTLLYKQIGAIETKEPLLATFENSQQKIGLLLGENSWKWRMSSYSNHQTFELFDGFIAHLIQYLSSNNSANRLQVDINPIYYTSETIQVTANYLDQNLNADTRAKLWMTIMNKASKVVNKIPFSKAKSNFYLEISNIPAGEYSYNISIENQDVTASGNFSIVPFEVEQQFSNSNDVSLNFLATKTKGSIYFENQEDFLIETLLNDKRFKNVQKSSVVKSSLINWKWILGIIILLLSLEWFTRKYYGKI